ncbi:MAG: hypothetical protein ACYC6K_10090 [Bellilinea sp.]
MERESVSNRELLEKYKPLPNPWFSSNIAYQGWGKATFEKPKGTVEGKTRINVSENGEFDAVMEMEHLFTTERIAGKGSFQICKFVTGNLGSDNEIVHTGKIENPCSGMTVTTDDGIFNATGNIYHGVKFGFEDKIKFYISSGNFLVNNCIESVYWIAPLTNFIRSFPYNFEPLIVNHPLRLFITPVIPTLSDEGQMRDALLAANRANTIIGFSYKDRVGYIQPTIDYNEKAGKIKSGDIKQGITALMVSDIAPDMDEENFSEDCALLLSIAIGNPIACPWIEFRDKLGNLVSRKHVLTIKSEYKEGYAIISESNNLGISQLLSAASIANAFHEDYYHVLLTHLARLQSFSRQIEDHMDLLCRTFDFLGEVFDLGTQNLMDGLSLVEKQEINLILQDAVEKLEQLELQTDNYSKNKIQQIQDRIINANNVSRAFGLTVMDLLAKFNLCDEQVMNNYYSHQSKREKRTWAGKLSMYRGTVIHNGYFQTRNGLHNFDEIIQTEDHLHDILVRIALKILNFEGNYQPRMIRPFVTDKTANWVTETTPAEELGYGRLER